MQVGRRAASSLILALLLAPAVAWANFGSSNKDLTVTTTSAAYRYKNDRLWQLSTLSAGTITQTVSTDSAEYLVGQVDGAPAVFVSTNGLSYTVVPLPSIQNIRLFEMANQVFAFGDQGGSVVSFQLASPGSVITFGSIANQTTQNIQAIGRALGQTYLVLSDQTSTTAFTLSANSWQPSASLSCAQTTVYTQPFLAIFCPSTGQVLSPDTQGSWQPVFSTPVGLVSGDGLLVGVSSTLNSIVLTDGKLITTINYDPAMIGQIKNITVFGGRVFVAANHLYELEWSGNVGFSLLDTNPAATLVAEQGGSGVYSLGDRANYSIAPGNVTAVTVLGAFNAALLLGNGAHLIWQKGGASTAIAAPGSGAYQTLTTSWAKTSQIQDVIEQNGHLWLLLINSSGNFNVYTSADQASWSRVTLPTAPTSVVSVADARALPAGSLVELAGTVSLPPNIIAADTAYIQDQLAGIQLYLSTSKGQLNLPVGTAVVADGQISTAQAKRVLLDSPADVETTGSGTVQPATITPTDAPNNLGRLVTLRAQITAVQKDHFNFDSLKIHAATNFGVGDLVETTGVVDLNSSSGAVEQWVAGSPILLQAAAPAPSPTPVTKPVSTKAKTTTAAMSSKPSSPPASPAVTPPLMPSATPVPTALVSAASDTTNTASNQNQTQTTMLLSALSFLAGIITVRGKRFTNLA